jgi:hypothetical protein
MRPAGIIAILLILLVLTAGCGQRVPTRNTTTKNPWSVTPTSGKGGSNGTPVVPTTTGPLIQATLIPEKTVTESPVPTIRSPPPIANATANLTLIDEKDMAFSYNKTAFNYDLQNPPLLIKYTLTVPNITRTGVEKDPTKAPTADDPNPTREVTYTYPDPAAWFQVSVMDLGTKKVIIKDGYGGQYDVSFNKSIWVRYPGKYYIEFSGQRLSAHVDFWIPKEAKTEG